MEIDETGIGLPPRGDPFYLLVVRPFVETQKVLKAALSADVVARKHIDPTQASQEHILRGPPADSPNPRKILNNFGVAQLFEALNLHIFVDNPLR